MPVAPDPMEANQALETPAPRDLRANLYTTRPPSPSPGSSKLASDFENSTTLTNALAQQPSSSSDIQNNNQQTSRQDAVMAEANTGTQNTPAENTKTLHSENVTPTPLNNIPPKPRKPWSGLFTTKERGPALFKSFPPARGPRSKNQNAMIVKITHLHDVPSDTIIKALAESYNKIILGAKMRFTRLGRSHLEIIFGSFTELQQHVLSGIKLLGQTLSGYYASRNERTYINIALKNMPIVSPEKISMEIKRKFDNIYPVTAIKPLYFAGTNILTDQWQVTVDITDKEHILSKIPRFIEIFDCKVTLSWKDAPIVCFFCEKEGHFRKDCEERKKAKENNATLEQLKENTDTQETEVIEPDYISDEPGDIMGNSEEELGKSDGDSQNNDVEMNERTTSPTKRLVDEAKATEIELENLIGNSSLPSLPVSDQPSSVPEANTDWAEDVEGTWTTVTNKNYDKGKEASDRPNFDIPKPALRRSQRTRYANHTYTDPNTFVTGRRGRKHFQ